MYKLRNLVEMANNINLSCTNKLVKSSQTLQIIQSRLAYKQQLYTDALLNSSSRKLNGIHDEAEETEKNGAVASTAGSEPSSYKVG